MRFKIGKGPIADLGPTDQTRVAALGYDSLIAIMEEAEKVKKQKAEEEVKVEFQQELAKGVATLAR